MIPGNPPSTSRKAFNWDERLHRKQKYSDLHVGISTIEPACQPVWTECVLVKMVNSPCARYNTSEFVALAAVNSALGGVSLLACLFVIGLIFLFKKYLIFTQRLILYLTVGAALESLCLVTQAAVYFPMTGAYKGYCVWSAFLNQTTNWSQLMAVCCITFDLFLTAVLNKKSRREWIYILAIFVFPILINWIPFIGPAYGPAGPWCWIQTVNLEMNCTMYKFGVTLSVVLWLGLLYPILTVVLVTNIFILASVRYQVRTFQGKYDPDTQKRKQMMAKVIQPLLAYPIIFFFLYIFSFINRVSVMVTSEPNMALFWLEAITTPLNGGIIALVYALDKDTRKRLRWSKLKGECLRCCFEEEEILEYPVEQSKTDSLIYKEYSVSLVPYASSDTITEL